MRYGNCDWACPGDCDSQVYRLPMRYGNFLPPMMVRPFCDVYRLPMRYGNLSEGSIPPLLLTVYRLPMRYGNPVWRGYRNYTSRFIDYLWGMETFWAEIGSRRAFWVYRLPMRYGNLPGGSLVKTFPQVYRLPMRYGNSEVTSNSKLEVTFIDYLWGMETSSWPSSLANAIAFIDYLWGMETQLIQPE